MLFKGRDVQHRTPAMYAATAGHANIMELLLNAHLEEVESVSNEPIVPADPNAIDIQ
jgi:ankyrin repeat protein